MRTLTVLSAALLTLCLAACKPASAPPTAQEPATDSAQPAAPASVETPIPTEPPIESVSILSVTPAEMRTCDKNAPVMLSWDASSVPGVKGVEIWMSNANKEPKLFGRGPAKGEKQTGAWVRPGATFTLKNQADGSEIAHAEIKGLPCE